MGSTLTEGVANSYKENLAARVAKFWCLTALGGLAEKSHAEARRRRGKK